MTKDDSSRVWSVSTADGGGAPQRRLECGCWQAEIVGQDGQKRWLSVSACEQHREEADRG